jgi:hypothetical protein
MGRNRMDKGKRKEKEKRKRRQEARAGKQASPRQPSKPKK